MFAKIMLIIVKSITVLPVILKDVEGATAKIKADATVVSKIHDGLDAVLAAFDAIAPIL